MSSDAGLQPGSHHKGLRGAALKRHEIIYRPYRDLNSILTFSQS
jgi:hypothetical protein